MVMHERSWLRGTQGLGGWIKDLSPERRKCLSDGCIACTSTTLRLEERTLEALAKRSARPGETTAQSYDRLWAEHGPAGDEFRALLQIRE
jgi:hypothetical protein